MGRRVFDFTLRGSGPEHEALVSFLNTYKNGDVRKYNEFIRNALMAYFTHISYCETAVREGGEPLPHLPFGHVKPNSPSIAVDSEIETVDRNGVVHNNVNEIEAPTKPSVPHVVTEPQTHNHANENVREVVSVSNSMNVSDDEVTVIVDDFLGSLLEVDDDIP
ncbi:hypothetical protein BM526_20100 (plasmid) [Alteromonas mediterranea]|uniref:hypothetical protein n=1 Tax=Alteromonas mediterranea TaxID=314275 RepID=UPI0009034A9F|nr:hypothetical protein [Alteromonas mediterranea]APE04276.1 hypothetical protein BM526_20100 [Alteromonas mediterranea]